MAGRGTDQDRAGQSDIAFDKRDKRFADDAWQNVPYFKLLGQSYRLFEMWIDRMYQQADGTWQNKARARFAADVITAAVAPTNYLGTNPEAMRKAFQTGGLSLMRGPRTCCRTWPRAGCPP